jgi:antitoxin VapB
MNEHIPSQLNIKNARTIRAAAELAELTGESLTGAVTVAVEERLQREKRLRDKKGRAARLLAIGKEYSALPDRDTRTPEEIIGYDENGLPT